MFSSRARAAAVALLLVITGPWEADAARIRAWGAMGEDKYPVPEGDDFVAITTGDGRNVALRADGSLVQWGSIFEVVEDRWPMPDEADFVAIASGAGQGAAVRTDGSLVRWGRFNTVPDRGRYCDVSISDEFLIGLTRYYTIVQWPHHDLRQREEWVRPYLVLGEVLLGLRTDVRIADEVEAQALAMSLPWPVEFGEMAPDRIQRVYSLPKSDGTFLTVLKVGLVDGLGVRAAVSLLDETDFTDFAEPNYRLYPPEEYWYHLAIDAESHNAVGLGSLGLDGTVVSPWLVHDHPEWRPEATDLTAIAAGASHTLALRGDGSLVAWNIHDQWQELDIPEGSDFAAIAAGDGFSLALQTDGSLTAWGNNLHGQLDVPPGNRFVAVAASAATALALEVPEPSTLVGLLSMGLLSGLVAWCRARRRLGIA